MIKLAVVHETGIKSGPAGSQAESIRPPKAGQIGRNFPSAGHRELSISFFNFESILHLIK